jgi:hypothetical protein
MEAKEAREAKKGKKVFFVSFALLAPFASCLSSTCLLEGQTHRLNFSFTTCIV